MLNLVNKTSALVSGLKKLGIQAELPMVGTISSLNETKFKYSPSGNVKDTLVIKKIDLGLLFQGIEQDVTNIEFGEQPNLILPELDDVTDGQLKSDGNLNDRVVETIDPSDYYEAVFNNWIRLVGLNDLSYQDVTISIGDGLLNVTPTYSNIYTGTVSIKFEEPIEDVIDDSELTEPTDQIQEDDNAEHIL